MRAPTAEKTGLLQSTLLGDIKNTKDYNLGIYLPIAACNATYMTIHDVGSRVSLHSTRVSLPWPVY